jgi:hypothetical protein
VPPPRTLGVFSLPLHLLQQPRARYAILGLLHRIPSISWRFDSTSPQDLQTLSGSPSPKVFSRFSFDLFDLLLNFINARSLYLGTPLECRYLALNLVWNHTSCLAYLKTMLQSLIFCDLLSYPTMQVIILEYVVPRVLEFPCVKFDRVSMSKI